jgi:hypothetical protein
MWDPSSRRVHVTRDITWLNRMFFRDANSESELEDQFEQILRNRQESTTANNQNTSEDSLNEADETDGNLDEDNVSLEELDLKKNSYALEDNVITTTTQSGRISKPPKRFVYYIIAAADICKEFMGIGASIDKGIVNTMESQVKTYQQAMKSADKEKWEAAVNDEHQSMVKHEVWTLVSKSVIINDDKVITTTWAMKRKANGTYRTRLNVRGYEQVEGLHFDAQYCMTVSKL